MSDRTTPLDFDAIANGQATDADRERLAQQLRDDPEALDDFIRFMDLHAALHRAAHDTPAAVTTDRADSTPDLDESAPDLGDKARGKPSPCRATTTQTAKDHSRKRNRPFSLLRHWQLWAAAAAIVLAIPAFGIFSYIFRDTGTKRPVVTSLGDPVAVLFEASDDAEFTFDGPGDHDNYLQNGKPVHAGVVDLKYGSLMFRFHSNAEVTLKAPAKFGLNHPKRAFLHHGELSAFCPEEARGFTIGAPGCAVIDLGTRFWMKVDKLGFTDVTVREGKVNLKRDNGELVSLLRGASARAPRELTQRLTTTAPLLTAPIFTITHATGDLYIDQTIARIGDEHPAGMIDLTSGLASLRLANGVDLKLRGKTRLALDNLKQAAFTVGSADFDCAAVPETYTVDLPDGSQITNQGARFLVHVSDTGRCAFRVTHGQVTWTSADPSAEPVMVETGRAMEIVEGRIGPSIPGETILFTDFTGVNTTATIATAVTWDIARGIRTPASTLTFTGPIHGFFPDFDRLAVNRNLSTEGPWSTSIELVLDETTAAIDLAELSLVVQAINNDGGLQVGERTIRFAVELIGSRRGAIGSAFVDHVEPAGGTGTTARVDLHDLPTLTRDETYTLTLTASTAGFGVHACIDDLALIGQVIPVEPTPKAPSFPATGAGSSDPSPHQNQRRRGVGDITNE